MKKIRVAIVGLGFGQSVLIPVFQSHPQCQVVALVATRLEKARAVADSLGIAGAYDDFKKLLDNESVDLLCIATPPGEQFAIAKEAISRNIAVFLEKPLCLNLEQSHELIKMATLHKIPAMIDFEFSEIPLWQECRQRIQQSAIGRIEHIEVNWSLQTYMNQKRLNSWKTETAQGGGALYSFGSHVFHSMEWFFGQVLALRCHMGRSPLDQRATDTLVLLDLQFSSGALASIKIDTDNAFNQEYQFLIKGSEGELELKNRSKDYIQGFTLQHKTKDPVSSKEIKTDLTWGESPLRELNQDGRILAVSTLANRLVKWLQMGESSEPNLASGVRVQEMIAMSLISHNQGGVWQRLR